MRDKQFPFFLKAAETLPPAYFCFENAEECGAIANPKIKKSLKEIKTLGRHICDG